MRKTALGVMVLGSVLISNSANAANKQVTVYTADWCSSCQQFKSQTLNNPKVKDKLKGYGINFIDVDENPEAARKAGVVGLPTIVINKGGKITKFVGFVGPGKFIGVL